VPFRGGKCISVCSASARRLFAACFPHARSLVVPQLDPARRLAAGLAACFPLAGCPLPLPPLAVCSPLAPRLPAPCFLCSRPATARRLLSTRCRVSARRPPTARRPRARCSPAACSLLASRVLAAARFMPMPLIARNGLSNTTRRDSGWASSSGQLRRGLMGWGWDGMGWDGMWWGGMGCGGVGWDGMGWDVMRRGCEGSGMGWGSDRMGGGGRGIGPHEMGWGGMRWDGMGWGGVGWDVPRWRMGQGGTHPIASPPHPTLSYFILHTPLFIPSHRIASHRIPSHPIPSHFNPIPSHPIPSHRIPFTKGS
jgi:hypothetical protein